jgi:hypothetical protein
VTLARDLRDLRVAQRSLCEEGPVVRGGARGLLAGGWGAALYRLWLGGAWVAASIRAQLGGRREPTDVAHLGGDVEPSTQAIPGAVIPSDPATV